jgi:hypothetical protein
VRKSDEPYGKQKLGFDSLRLVFLNRSLRSLCARRLQIPLPVQGEGKRAWRARVRAASTQSLISIQAAHLTDSLAQS